jgi:hypothetical protein
MGSCVATIPSCYRSVQTSIECGRPIGNDSEIAHFPGITFVLTASCEVEEGTQATRRKGRLREVGSRGLTQRRSRSRYSVRGIEPLGAE